MGSDCSCVGEKENSKDQNFTQTEVEVESRPSIMRKAPTKTNPFEEKSYLDTENFEGDVKLSMSKNFNENLVINLFDSLCDDENFQIHNLKVKKTLNNLQDFDFNDVYIDFILEGKMSKIRGNKKSQFNNEKNNTRYVIINIDSSTFMGQFEFPDEETIKKYETSNKLNFDYGNAIGRRVWHDDCTVFDGPFKNGQFNGEGRIIYRNGDYY